MNYKYLISLFSIFFLYSNASAQILEFVGEIPEAFKGSSVTVFYEGECDDRVRSATFLALKAAGYRVFVDGERRPQFGGLVTSVMVSDTTFTRRGRDVVVRSIHGNQPTDLVATVSGSFSNVNVRRIFIDIINQQTGELLQSITCKQRNVSLGYDRYSVELLSILDPNARPTLPRQIRPRS